jgi:hypothetical protein
MYKRQGARLTVSWPVPHPESTGYPMPYLSFAGKAATLRASPRKRSHLRLSKRALPGKRTLMA